MSIRTKTTRNYATFSLNGPRVAVVVGEDGQADIDSTSQTS